MCIRDRMSTVHQLPDGLTMLTKGAVDVMLGRTRLSPEEKAEIERMNEELSQQGLRVLAFGKRMLTAPAIGLEDENDLQFLGLIAMMDPPREESKAAVRAVSYTHLKADGGCGHLSVPPHYPAAGEPGGKLC